MRHPRFWKARPLGSQRAQGGRPRRGALRPDATVDFADLLDFCSERMPYFCVPRYLEVLDEIPKNVIGRVRKDVLRSRVSARPHGTAKRTATC
jgi:crotonobetaine/carnitine-CoA ligase